MRSMFRLGAMCLFGACLGATAAAQTEAKSDHPAETAKPSPALEAVLTEMDRSAGSFRSAEATFVWEQYQKVVDETDVQKGTAFFVRSGKDTQMAAHVTSPDRKFLIYSDGKIRFYQPRIEQLTEYETGNKKDEVESFLLLGFGGRGHELLKSFEVKLGGKEKLDGIETAKLELVPKVAKVKNMFSHMTIWVDTERAVSLKQMAYEPSGDVRTAYYTGIKLNARLPDDAFKLKTTAKTKVVHPQ